MPYAIRFFVQVLKLKCAFNTSTRRKYKQFYSWRHSFGIFFSSLRALALWNEGNYGKPPLTIIAIKYQMWNIHVLTINTKCYFPYGGWRKGGDTEDGLNNMHDGIVNNIEGNRHKFISIKILSFWKTLNIFTFQYPKRSAHSFICQPPFSPEIIK